MKKTEDKWSRSYDNNDLDSVQEYVKILEGNRKSENIDMLKSMITFSFLMRGENVPYNLCFLLGDLPCQFI